MKLTHLGISHFRSIGETPVMIDLSKKITVLVGQNDCGKSNVLRGIQSLAAYRKSGPLKNLGQHDFHKLHLGFIPSMHICADLDDIAPQIYTRLGKADLCVPLITGKGEASLHNIERINDSLLEKLDNSLGGTRIASHVLEENLANMRARITSFLMREVSALIPEVILIPQFRKIEPSKAYAVNGQGIINLLGSWQNPGFGKRHENAKFQRVRILLRELLNRSELELDVPRDESDVIVSENGIDLPLESHGTGIHQLIILAIASMSEDKAIFGIEEPETHMHPVLQRRFLKFLREETGNNRYIITTHSQTMIAPAEDVDVIHLKMVDGVTIPTRVTTDAHALEALDDLGVRASDLLQANAVIWVEGPSDRIYLKHWMALVSRELGGPELIEGIDYAMMFYGGRLLSHLSLEREGEGEIDDGFIQLLRINQRSAIVMDSDRKKRDDALNTTKQRVITECDKNRLHAWVTDGREIENYLTQRTVEAAAAEAGISLDDRFSLAATGKIDDSFKRMVGAKAPSWCDYATNKVPWAHRFVKHIELQDISATLKDQVKALLHFIRPNT